MEQGRTQAGGRTPQQARSRQTVERILGHVEELVVTEGIGGLSMRKIAKGAGVGQATLYAYFPTPESLLAALGARVAETVKDVLDGLPEVSANTLPSELSDAYFAAFTAFYEDHPVAHRLFEALEAQGLLDDTVTEALETFLAHFSQALHRIAPSLEKKELTRIALGYYRIADAFLWQPPPSEPDQWRRLLRRTLADYLHAAAGKSDI